MGRSAKKKTRKRAAPASKVLESITGSDALSILTVPTGLNGGCASCESESGEGMTPNVVSHAISPGRSHGNSPEVIHNYSHCITDALRTD